jgi:hypothetical protein
MTYAADRTLGFQASAKHPCCSGQRQDGTCEAAACVIFVPGSGERRLASGVNNSSGVGCVAQNRCQEALKAGSLCMPSSSRRACSAGMAGVVSLQVYRQTQQSHSQMSIVVQRVERQQAHAAGSATGPYPRRSASVIGIFWITWPSGRSAVAMTPRKQVGQARPMRKPLCDEVLAAARRLRPDRIVYFSHCSAFSVTIHIHTLSGFSRDAPALHLARQPIEPPGPLASRRGVANPIVCTQRAAAAEVGLRTTVKALSSRRHD